MCPARRLDTIDEPVAHNEIALTKAEDVEFVRALVQQVSRWLQVRLH
jgi:hypothetical protein